MWLEKMLKELLKNTKFLSEIKKFFRQNEMNVIDMLLFGSFIRGKENPRDIDLMVLTVSNIRQDRIYELHKSLEKLCPNIEITSVSYKELLSSNFIARESFLTEGYSIINKKYVSEGLGFDSFVLIRYNISSLNKSDRMRFYYSLYGRGKRGGMLYELKGYKFSDNILMVPINCLEQAKDYIDNWKMKHFEIPVLIPSRIIQSKAFKNEI